MKDYDPVSAAVAELDALDLDGLRAAWRRHVSEPEPIVQTPEFVRRELAWRLMARAHGDMSAKLKRRLRSLSAPELSGATAPRPAPGVALVREWDGRTYRVTVLPEGYLYDGVVYASLTPIARLISGVHRSGPRFFGLTVPGAKR